jgi:hypothetical protein
VAVFARILAVRQAPSPDGYAKQSETLAPAGKPSSIASSNCSTFLENGVFTKFDARTFWPGELAQNATSRAVRRAARRQEPFAAPGPPFGL